MMRRWWWHEAPAGVGSAGWLVGFGLCEGRRFVSENLVVGGGGKLGRFCFAAGRQIEK